MKKISYLVVLVAAVALIVLGVEHSTVNTELYLGDVTLSGGYQASHFPQVWDLTACNLVISFTYDANGLVDTDPNCGDWSCGDHAWSELGIREIGAGNFNPGPGKGVWLATDFDEAWPPTVENTFAPDPPGSPTLDMDDKLMLQKAGGQGEGDYNLPSTPPNPGANHRIWWDRDGVDPWQNDETANTGGIYNIEITLHATSDTSGEAYMRINGLYQGFETDGDWNTIELIPAGMTFIGDMTQMQVFYGLYGYGATHSVNFEDITVSGCLVLEEGMATGGGWFIPENNNFMGDTSGGKATFGFIAKQKKGNSSGNLEFQYHADGLNLKSDSYDWVHIATTQAMFEGIGTLNGEFGHKFRVRAVDGDKNGTGNDRFEIRIWTTGTWEMPTFRAEGDLSGGQIVVHKK